MTRADQLPGGGGLPLAASARAFRPVVFRYPYCGGDPRNAPLKQNINLANLGPKQPTPGAGSFTGPGPFASRSFAAVSESAYFKSSGEACSGTRAAGAKRRQL